MKLLSSLLSRLVLLRTLYFCESALDFSSSDLAVLFSSVKALGERSAGCNECIIVVNFWKILGYILITCKSEVSYQAGQLWLSLTSRTSYPIKTALFYEKENHLDASLSKALRLLIVSLLDRTPGHRSATKSNFYYYKFFSWYS